MGLVARGAKEVEEQPAGKFRGFSGMCPCRRFKSNKAEQPPRPSQHRARGWGLLSRQVVVTGISTTEKENLSTFFLLFGEGIHT